MRLALICEQLNYSVIHRERAPVIGESAFKRAMDLWEQDCTSEGSVASAIAGLILFQNQAVRGLDKLAVPFILRTQHIVKRANLFRRDLSERTYDPGNVGLSRSRAIVAWGMYAYLR